MMTCNATFFIVNFLWKIRTKCTKRPTGRKSIGNSERVMEKTPKCYCILINKGNRTKWSPIHSVIISVFYAVVRFVKSRVSSQIELDDSKFFYQLIIATTKFVIFLIRLLKIKTQEIPIVLCPAVKKKSYLSVARWRVLSNYLGITRTVLLHYCQLIANQIWEFVIVMINTKIGSRWHYINRAHLQIPLDPLLPIEQEFPRLSAYDRAYSGSYHVDLYYRPVSRWMMGHAVKAKRKWLKEDKTCAELAPVIQTFDSTQPVRVQIVWMAHFALNKVKFSRSPLWMLLHWSDPP